MPFKIVPMITATVSDRLTDRHSKVRLRASLGKAMRSPFHHSRMSAMGRKRTWQPRNQRPLPGAVEAPLNVRQWRLADRRLMAESGVPALRGRERESGHRKRGGHMSAFAPLSDMHRLPHISSAAPRAGANGRSKRYPLVMKNSQPCRSLADLMRERPSEIERGLIVMPLAARGFNGLS